MICMKYDSNHWHYKQELKKYPVLTEEEERKLGYLIKNGSLEEQKFAKKRLIEGNLRLVIKLAYEYVEYSNNDNIISDMVQEGNLGLIKAVEKYDPSYKNKFATYAGYWIRRGILKAIAESNSKTKSHNINEKISELKTIEKELYFLSDREPTEQDIVNEYNRLNILKIPMTVKEYHDLTLINDMLSFEENGAQINEENLIDLNTDIENEIVSNVYNENLKKILDEIIDKKLTKKEKDIILRRFGLNNTEIETFKEISNDYNCTGERIRQIESNALEKLNKTLKLNKYKNRI